MLVVNQARRTSLIPSGLYDTDKKKSNQVGYWSCSSVKVELAQQGSLAPLVADIIRLVLEDPFNDP